MSKRPSLISTTSIFPLLLSSDIASSARRDAASADIAAVHVLSRAWKGRRRDEMAMGFRRMSRGGGLL